MERSTTSKVVGWISFIPAYILFIVLFKICLYASQMWIRDQVHEDSGWGYFVATTTFSSFWIPYLLQYFIFIRILMICPMPRVASVILFILAVGNIIRYYFVLEGEFAISVFLAELVALGTFGYYSFKQVEY
jgi:hypothetical protein